MYKKPELICNPKEFEHCTGTTFHMFLKFTNLAVLLPLFLVLAVRGVYADVGKGQKGGAVYKTMDEVGPNCFRSGEGKVTDGLEGSCCRKFQELVVFLVFSEDMWFFM